MLLEFKLYKVNTESRLFKIIAKYDNSNVFIVVGEHKEYFKVHQLTKKGLCLVGGMPLDGVAYSIKKTDLTLSTDGFGVDYTELEIPKEYLTVDLIETIQKLNS
jgi:hypothetical protein